MEPLDKVANADGLPMNVRGAVTFPLVLGSVTLFHRFLIVENCSIPFLLGNTVMGGHRAGLDYESNQMRLFQNHGQCRECAKYSRTTPDSNDQWAFLPVDWDPGPFKESLLNSPEKEFGLTDSTILSKSFVSSSEQSALKVSDGQRTDHMKQSIEVEKRSNDVADSPRTENNSLLVQSTSKFAKASVPIPSSDKSNT